MTTPRYVTLPDPDLLTAARAGHLAAAVEPQARPARTKGAVDSAAELAAERRAAFVEDVEFMAGMGETTEGAAERLGVSPQALHKRLTDPDRKILRHDLWEQLRANEVSRFGAQLNEIRSAQANSVGQSRRGSSSRREAA